MIAYVKGTLAEINVESIVVDAGGIGYEILTYNHVISRLPGVGSEVKIVTYMDVKEDSMTLYGFLSGQEKTLFKQLISVNSVGPKGALSILNELGPDNLVAAVISGDSKSISKAKGIGAKTAQKVILELRDKISTEGSIFDPSDVGDASDMEASAVNDAVQALCELGYSNMDALKAVKKVENAESMEVGKIISAALRFL